jgi:hypothetical protein
MSKYSDKLDAAVGACLEHPGTSGQRALRSILLDLNGSGPVSELLHTLDDDKFILIMDLFSEFRRTGYREGFMRLHGAAADKVTF